MEQSSPDSPAPEVVARRVGGSGAGAVSLSYSDDGIPNSAYVAMSRALMPQYSEEGEGLSIQVQVTGHIQSAVVESQVLHVDEDHAPEQQDQATIKIQDSTSIAAVTFLQHVVASYPAIKHVFKMLGAELPNISISSIMIPLQVICTVYKLGYVLPTYEDYNKPYDNEMVIISAFSIINYAAKLVASDIFNIPMLQQNSSKMSQDNLAQVCVAHGMVQIFVDNLMSSMQSYVLGENFLLEGNFLRNSPSILYGTTFTVVSCAKNNEVELSSSAKIISTTLSFVTGGILGYCLYNPTYSFFDVLNNLVKVFVGIATTNKIVNAIFAAHPGGYFYNEAAEDRQNLNNSEMLINNIAIDLETKVGEVPAIDANCLES